MRLSSHKDDPGYLDWGKLNGDGKVALVFLDGVKQKNAFMADDELGEVGRYVTSEEGNLAYDPTAGIAFTETVKGKVEIVIESRR